jgi:Tfp pilus assembly protein PilN
VRLPIAMQRPLAALSDAELADRLQSACARYDAADTRRQEMAVYWTPMRAAKYPSAYRFWMTLTGSPGFRVFEWAIKAIIVGSWNKGDLIERTRLLVTDEAIAMDAEIEEISAITKEIERRVTGRKRAAGRS